MLTTDTVVIGAGHAGLAVSHLLTAEGRDHLVLERGRLAERWHSERWDSLHLLTPGWMARLPGYDLGGSDPDRYLAVGDFVRRLERYARSFDAPVVSHTTVLEVVQAGAGYLVTTDQGMLTARHVVVATGPWGRPRVPDHVDVRGTGTHLTTASRYRNPQSLPDGGVLVVGASSSGVQIADELARAGRRVVLAVGRHSRVPRRYRGMDIFWWLERTGRLARTIDEVADPAAARREPSLQLVGRNRSDGLGEDLDLRTLAQRGVRLTGRLRSLHDGRATFADDLAGTVADADRRMHRLLDSIDRHVEATGLAREVWDPDRPEPVPLPGTGPSPLLRTGGIGTVLLACGYRPDHPWLRVPVTGPDGAIRQHRGVTPAPGLYVVGQRFQHRRDSGFIDGARHDATAVVAHLTGRRTTQTPVR